MSKSHMQDCHTSQRAKMANITGSPKNFESTADKADRFCRGGYDSGGEVEATPLPPSPFMDVKPTKAPRLPRKPVTPPANEL